MRVYRYLAGAAAVVITVVGMATVTTGSQPPPPPAVHLRGLAVTSTSDQTDGLEFVPAPVIDMKSTSTQTTTSTEVAPSSTTTTSDDDSDFDDRTADTPDSADSPDG